MKSISHYLLHPDGYCRYAGRLLRNVIRLPHIPVFAITETR
jgi:hypothetical protein